MQIAIFILTLILVIWQPRGLSMGFTALGGALLALITGIVTLQDVAIVWGMVWNATLTAIALIIISRILDEAGFFRGLALWLAYAGLGRGRLFFVLLMVLGALLTANLSNYGTALIWTPTLMEMLLLLGFSSKATFALVFATGFIADATSLPLSTSNLVNLISTDYFNISFFRYLLVMIPVNFVAIATGTGVIWFYFDRYIPFTYNLDRMPPPDSVIRDPVVCQWSFAVLGSLLIGYFLAQPLGIPVSSIAVSGALVMLAISGRWFHQDNTAILSLRKVWCEIPWSVLGFSLGMSILALSWRNTELTTLLSQLLKQLSGWGLTQVAMGTGFLATLLSGVMNNIPAVLINSLAIQDVLGIDSSVREVMMYANVIGCDLGGKITPIGSLSTLLWLNILARQGRPIAWEQYIRIAFIVTLPVLSVSLLGLAIWLPWLIV
ncbi:arsenical efflux pump membrane protein ArsB [Microcoleus sp. FACHB-53]|nr:arsenical efflux pump membrane protein ArsB [Microcoleus sp. FACHB-53]